MFPEWPRAKPVDPSHPVESAPLTSGTRGLRDVKRGEFRSGGLAQLLGPPVLAGVPRVFPKDQAGGRCRPGDRVWRPVFEGLEQTFCAPSYPALICWTSTLQDAVTSLGWVDVVSTFICFRTETCREVGTLQDKVLKHTGPILRWSELGTECKRKPKNSAIKVNSNTVSLKIKTNAKERTHVWQNLTILNKHSVSNRALLSHVGAWGQRRN